MAMKDSICVRAAVCIGVLLTFGFINSVSACSCKAQDARTSLPGADAVFSGRVIEVEYVDEKPMRSGDPRVVVTLEVYRIWKGARAKTIVLHTVYNQASCAGYFFKKGEEFLVVAKKNDPATAALYPKSTQSLGVGLCGGTARLTEAATVVRLLGKGKKPK